MEKKGVRDSAQPGLKRQKRQFGGVESSVV